MDRYDARGALHDLSSLEAPPGGFDWRVELTKTELDVEQLCDEERYRALHTDEDEEEMYKGWFRNIHHPYYIEVHSKKL